MHVVPACARAPESAVRSHPRLRRSAGPGGEDAQEGNLMPRTRKSIMLAGAAAALVGAGAATAATAAASGGPAPRPLAAPDHAVRPPAGRPLPGTAAIAASGRAALRPAGVHAPASHAAVSHPAARHPAARHPAARHEAARHAPARHPAASHPAAVTWSQVSEAISRQTTPAAARHGRTPAADQLLPVRTSGTQQWMPINPAQAANATTIVRQALGHRMGVRSAVIAVATAMQESMLQNIDYGTGTALGLFQQQPDSGWGTPAQVTNPVYASRAFLSALQRHQASDPAWARQPLWANAQAVQNSAFPQAYAKWESQAASLVRHIAMREARANRIAVKLP
jgi:hypothetical protein